MKTDTELRAKTAAYMRSHRAAWAEVGFTPMSGIVHKNDKPKLSAYTDLTKFETLLSLVNKDDLEAIDLAATRNRAKLPTFDMVEEVKEMAEKQMMLNPTKARATQALQLLHSVKNYGAKARAQQGIVTDDRADDKAAALAVVYSNLAAATYRLAEALVRYSPDLGEIDEC